MGKAEQSGNFSNNVIWYNFILCILVVFIHAHNEGIFTASVSVFGVSIFNEIESFIAEDIAITAVGGFYLCSGYLFFRSYSWEKVLPKYKSRVGGILIPYILWTLIYFSLHVIISRIPCLAAVFEEVPIQIAWQTVLDAVLHYQYCAFMWFLQFLILYAAVSPIIYFLIRNRYLGAVTIFVVFFTACTNIIKNGQAAAVTNWMVLYITGGYAGIHFRTWIECKKADKGLFLGSLILAFAAFWINKAFPSVFGLLFYCFAFAAVLWCFLTWEKGSSGALTMPAAREWQKNTFAVYMTHFIFVQGANKVVSMYVSRSMWAGFMLFISLPAVCFGAVCLAKKICGNGKWILWKILMGNR